MSHRDRGKLSEIRPKRSWGETAGDLRGKDQAGDTQTSPWTRILEDAWIRCRRDGQREEPSGPV